MPEKEKILKEKKLNLKEIFATFYKKITAVDEREKPPVKEVMLDIIIALLPAAIFGCVVFGWMAAAVLAVGVLSAVLAEFLWNIIFKKPQTVLDLSAAVTGLLFGMVLPSTAPLWLVALGSIFAVVGIKLLLGGTKWGFLNPVAATRFLLLAVFPTMVTKFVLPFNVDTVASATSLDLAYRPDAVNITLTLKDAFFGIKAGCIGEVSIFLLIIGGLYLIIRRIVSPIIPICFVGTVALASLIAGQNVALAVLGGGLVIGALFVATDYFTTPTTPLGKVIFGVGCGVITFIIRSFTPWAEGVAVAVLVMNLLSPIFHRLITGQKFNFSWLKPVFEKLKALWQWIVKKSGALWQWLKNKFSLLIARIRTKKEKKN